MTAEPVFVDRSGRRRRLIVAAGAGGTLALLIAAGALLAGFTGTSPGAVPGWPTSGPHHGVAKPHPATAASVTTRPAPPVVAATSVRHTVAPPPSPSPSPSPSQRSSYSASASAAPAVTTPVHGRGHSPSARPSKRN